MAESNGPRHARRESTLSTPVQGAPWRSPSASPRHARPSSRGEVSEFPMPYLVDEYYAFGGVDKDPKSLTTLTNKTASFIVETQGSTPEQGQAIYGFNIVDGRVAIYGLRKSGEGRYDVTEDAPTVLEPRSVADIEIDPGQADEDPRRLMQVALGERTLTLFSERGSALRVLAPEDFFIGAPRDADL